MQTKNNVEQKNTAKKQNYISILNRIKHKGLLLENVFPFGINRPFILPYLLNNDYILKLSMKESYKSLKTVNNFSDEINKYFYKFIS